jgi:hypothetical protein
MRAQPFSLQTDWPRAYNSLELLKEHWMTQKIIEVIGTSKESFAKAAEAAVAEAAKTVRGIKWRVRRFCCIERPPRFISMSSTEMGWLQLPGIDE